MHTGAAQLRRVAQAGHFIGACDGHGDPLRPSCNPQKLRLGTHRRPGAPAASSTRGFAAAPRSRFGHARRCSAIRGTTLSLRWPSPMPARPRLLAAHGTRPPTRSARARAAAPSISTHKLCAAVEPACVRVCVCACMRLCQRSCLCMRAWACSFVCMRVSARPALRHVTQCSVAAATVGRRPQWDRIGRDGTGRDGKGRDGTGRERMIGLGTRACALGSRCWRWHCTRRISRTQPRPHRSTSAGCRASWRSSSSRSVRFRSD